MIRKLAKKFDNFIDRIGIVRDKEIGIAGEATDEFVMQGLNYPENISTLMGYRSFDEDKELSYNDSSIGFVLEISPIVGVTDFILKNIEHFLNDELPQGSYLQFLLIASHKIGSILDRYAADRTGSDVNLNRLTAKRTQFISNLALNFESKYSSPARTTGIIISYNLDKSSDHEVFAFKKQLVKKLESLQLCPRVFDSQDLLDLTDEILHFRADIRQQGARYNPLMLLSEQVQQAGNIYDIKQEGLEFGKDMVTKCYRVVEYPEEWSLGNMIQLLGDSSRSSLNIPARFIISYIIASDINKGRTNALIGKGQALQKASEQWYSRYDTNLRSEAVNWIDVVHRLKSGERVLSEIFQVLITGNRESIYDAEASLLSLYNIYNWKLELNRNLQLPSLLSILPMQASRFQAALKLFKMTRLGLSREIVAKLPVHAEWKGVPETGVLLFARRGQLFNWNPFHRIADGNYNVCVFGPSGSGKSVFLQELTTSMLAMNTRVFILDIGGSYKNICNLLEGDFIQFKAEADISLNPFGSLALSGDLKNNRLEDGTIVSTMAVGEYVVATDSIVYAKTILASMCGCTGSHFRESILEESIIKAIEEYGINLNISKIAVILSKDASIEALQMSKTLYPYTHNGIYGKYFASDTNISFKNRLTIFELEEIKNDVNLLSVVLQVIGMQIFLQVLCGNRSQRFVLIVDEAWKILDHSARFLAELVRTLRKYGGSLVTCVQNYSDFQSSEYHQTIIKNSTWSVILKQNEQGLNSFKGTNFEEIIPLIRSISMLPGKYAEMLLYSTGIRVIGKLMLDPYSSTLFSTDSNDFVFIRNSLSKGMSIEETIEQLADFKAKQQVG